MKIVVAGAGGAIGGHLVGALLGQGHVVRAVDIKPRADWWQVHKQAQNLSEIDLRNPLGAERACLGADRLYNLAENMGGIGFITANKVDCTESIEIGISMLRAACELQVPRVFFSSSACVYPIYLQDAFSFTAEKLKNVGLVEGDAWPAQPEEGYGFSKLYMEELMKHYRDERGLEIRIARYHNVYGPHGTWTGGKEKAPAALCRKMAVSTLTGDKLEVWGSGNQLRSYLHVADCVRGTMALMESDYDEPMNIGSDFAVTVNEMIDLIEQVAHVKPERVYVEGAEGVAARNADITLAKKELGWEPEISLADGLADLYRWVFNQVRG